MFEVNVNNMTKDGWTEDGMAQFQWRTCSRHSVHHQDYHELQEIKFFL